MIKTCLTFLLIVLAASAVPAGSVFAQQRHHTASGSFSEDSDDVLVMQARAIFGALPQRMPGGAMDTAEQVALGRMLYHEKDLSVNRSQSCSTCHPLDGSRSGADNLAVSPGALGKPGARNAPTVLNAGYQIALFWDGRARTLSEQAKGPILNSLEMGMPHAKACIDGLKKSATYQQAFNSAFPGQEEPMTYENLARAIAAFERSLISRSRFDRFLVNDREALSAREKEGLTLFLNIGCIRCHGGPLLGGMLYQRLGIFHPYKNSADQGRYEVTKDEKDRYVFKVPMLRNVTLTAPYFHDGAVATLGEAVDEMARLELGARLDNEEIESILRFLTSLADEGRTTAPAPRAGKPAGWAPPDIKHISAGKEGELVRYGYQLLMNTPVHLGKGAKTRDMVYSNSSLACGNCHQEGGTKMYGIPWMGVLSRYPQYSSRSESQVFLEDRINDCLERSMNGRGLPKESREMKAIISYMTRLSKDVPEERAGLLRTPLAAPDRRADLSGGKEIYLEFCQSCHGSEGSGYQARSAESEGTFVIPPLWGPESYNTGAGMHRLLMSAAFVKGNMPLGTPWDRPVLTDDQAYDVAAYINSLGRPRLPNTEKDWPDLSKKPEDCPYPPYDDAFTQEQHRYGPFGPIREARKKLSKQP